MAALPWTRERMMDGTVLAIDQGTTGSTCLVVRLGATVRILGRGYAEVPQHFVQPGWVEHDLQDLWYSVAKSCKAALAAAKVTGKDIDAIGITNQRETTCAWSTQGAPLHRAIVWQDRRTASFCRAFKDAGHEPMVRQRTGLLLDPYFSATKIQWLMEHVEEVKRHLANKTARFGTVDSWLMWNLTAGKRHVTDVTNAARTLLFDIHRCAWDPELCALFGGIPQEALPEVHENTALFGKTEGIDFLPDGIAIHGSAGDQHAALFGQGCSRRGMAKCTYGTGAFALVNTGGQAVQSTRGLVSTIAWQHQGQVEYALEGSTFVAGAIVQWLRDGLGIINKSQDVETLAAQVPDSGGVTLVPALTGLGAPHWRPQARGLIDGITRGTTRAHIARAALEGIALQVYDLLDAMRLDSGGRVSELRVDGGAAANDMLMQFQADLLGIPTHRPAMVESTALGAAYLAGLGAGMFDSIAQVEKAWQKDRTFEPQGDRAYVRDVVQRWHAAVLKA